MKMMAPMEDAMEERETLGGARRERSAFNTLKVLWPPQRMLSQEDPAIKTFLEREYNLGSNGGARRDEAGMRAARSAIVVCKNIDLLLSYNFAH